MNGFVAKLNRLQFLIQTLEPKILALQEIKVSQSKNLYIKGYKIYKKCRLGVGGGVGLAIHNSVPSVELPVNTNLEVVACTVYFKNFHINICNVYFNDQADVSIDTLNELLVNVPAPRIFMGDVNAKHISWGSPFCNSRGNTLHRALSRNNLFILNDGSPTYFNVNTNYYSHLDISCVTDSISHNFHWGTYPDKLTSDHFPIVIQYQAVHYYTTKVATWVLDKANWGGYRSSLSFSLELKAVMAPEFASIQMPPGFADENVINDEIINSILLACSANIPKSGTVVNTKYSCLWWDNNCKEALHNAKVEFRALRRLHTEAQAIKCKRLDAIASRTLMLAKRDSWRKYVSTVNKDTYIGTLWNVVKSINGKPRSFGKIVLTVNDINISDPGGVSEALGRYFASIGSNDNYLEDFLLHKVEGEFESIFFPEGSNEPYNSDFSLKEMGTALNACKDTSPGEDGVHYRMLKNMSEEQSKTLLSFFNYLWVNNKFPEQWRVAIVLPFLKPNKVSTSPSSYRPISLTSCLCKLMERMVHNRLSHQLDILSFIKPYQSGFRRHHSTYDPLVRFEGAIQETFLREEYLVAVFLDIEKAYDMIWTHLVKKILLQLNFKGHLPEFIVNFLKLRKIKVRVGDVLSKEFLLENGLPQGSVLSPILFLLIINTIFEGCEDILSSLFCDDGKIWATAPTLEEAEEIIQGALNCISDWCDLNGPKLSLVKTTYTIFTRRKVYMEPTLSFKGTVLGRCRSVRYLGIIFDQKLTWKFHIKDLVQRCQKPFMIMEKVSKHDWGGDRTSLKLLYLSLIRSKIDYASFLYSTAAASHLIKLDRLQNRAIRIITGNMRCTSVYTLEVESGIIPLYYRRQQLALQYFGKVCRISDHIVTHLYHDFYNYDFYNHRPYALPVVGRCKKLVESFDLPINRLEKFKLRDLHTTGGALVKYSLLRNKHDYPAAQFLHDYRNLIDTEYQNSVLIFTDGSKIVDRCGCAFVAYMADGPHIVSKRLPNFSGIFSAELYAVLLAVRFAKTANLANVVIFFDSVSVLQSLERSKPDNRFLININKLLSNMAIQITFEWVPGHCNIPGNEAADRAAKDGTHLFNIKKLPILFTDLKYKIKSCIYDKWQSEWSRFNTRLNGIKPVISDWKSAYRDNRREEKVLSRLRTGCCRFLKQHYFDPMLSREYCDFCRVTMTIAHLLVQCVNLNFSRSRITSYLRKYNLPLTLYGLP